MAFPESNVTAERIMTLLLEELKADIVASGESLIEQAVKDFEKELRAKVAVAAAARAERFMDMRVNGNQLVISIGLHDETRPTK